MMTIVVGRLACREAQRREADARARPTCEARGGVPLEALDPDDPDPPDADPPPELVEGAPPDCVPEDPVEPDPDGTRGRFGSRRGGGGVGGLTAGAAGTVTGTVGVGRVGTVTVGRVGSGGGSTASAGATSMAATATAQLRIDEALRIRLYNPRPPAGGDASPTEKSANCTFLCGRHGPWAD